MEKTTTRNGTRLVTPAIGLERPEKYSDAGKFDKKIKCHKIGMTYFKDGTPEEWLWYKNQITRCLNGQGAPARPAKFTLARRWRTQPI